MRLKLTFDQQPHKLGLGGVTVHVLSLAAVPTLVPLVHEAEDQRPILVNPARRGI